MQRWIPILAALLGVQLLLAGALALRRGSVAGSPPDSPLLAAPIGTADRIVIDGQSASGAAPASAHVELLKRNGAWVVHSAYDMPVAAAKIDHLMARLTSLRHGLAIAETANAQKRFKVSSGGFERRITLSRGGKTLAQVYFGESAGLRKSDARVGGERAIYAVGLPSYQLPTDASDWFDDELLQVPADLLAEIDVGGAQRPNVTLTRVLAAGKAPGPWSAAPLARGKQVDTAQVEALARAIGELRVDKVLGEQPDPDWQLADPLLLLTVKSSDGKAATWTLAKPKSGDFDVLKSSAHPWYFSLGAAQAKPFLDAAAPGGLIAAIPPAAKRTAAAKRTPAHKPARKSKTAHSAG
ncbi:MAG TPA: DUF4340 domain-containing protein [Steroidobacteraceae bacterium]|nr:DUF4340 domain-containing protein [Steroidobacteraceae bacterium]